MEETRTKLNMHKKCFGSEKLNCLCRRRDDRKSECTKDQISLIAKVRILNLALRARAAVAEQYRAKFTLAATATRFILVKMKACNSIILIEWLRCSLLISEVSCPVLNSLSPHCGCTTLLSCLRKASYDAAERRADFKVNYECIYERPGVREP